MKNLDFRDDGFVPLEKKRDGNLPGHSKVSAMLKFSMRSFNKFWMAGGRGEIDVFKSEVQKKNVPR